MGSPTEPTMSDQLSDAEIEQGLKVCEAATPLDDRHELCRYDHGGGRLLRRDDEGRVLIADFYDEANREFYYLARTLLPAALQELRRLRQQIAEQARTWRERAVEFREEAGRIRRTIKEPTDAEERCNVRAEVWDQSAAALETLLGGTEHE